MFENRLQIAQACLAGAGLFALIAVLTLTFGPLVVGVMCLLLEHALAAVGCSFYADSKGYPPIIGIPIGATLWRTGYSHSRRRASVWSVERNL